MAISHGKGTIQIDDAQGFGTISFDGSWPPDEVAPPLPRFPHSSGHALRHSENYVNGFPDFSWFDGAIEGDDEMTDRQRAQADYYDLLDQRRD